LLIRSQSVRRGILMYISFEFAAASSRPQTVRRLPMFSSHNSRLELPCPEGEAANERMLCRAILTSLDRDNALRRRYLRQRWLEGSQCEPV